MRYFKFTLEGAPNGGWSSHVGSQMDPGAPLVELDITMASQDTTGTSGSFQVWGQPISVLKQSQSFYGKSYTLSVGMAPGLPLATQQSSEAGQILGGSNNTITNVYSEFEGLTQYLGFNLGGGPASKQTPPPFSNINQYPLRNIVLNWKKGTPLGQALMQCFQTAYPELTTSVNVSPNLVANQDNLHYSGTIADLNTWLRKFVCSEYVNSMPQGYPGVSIIMANGTISAVDGTQTSGGTQIQFTDLVGQPSFIAPNTIQVKVVMRGDLRVGDSIKLPVTAILNVSGNLGDSGNLVVSGAWTISSLRWVGNSRNPNGDAWVTIIEAIQTPGESQPAPTQ